MNDKNKYIVVTPAFNESDNIGITIDSMVNQTIKPSVWFIVDDGSRDNTWEIIQTAERAYPWIRGLKREKQKKPNTDGLLVASEAAAFLAGLKLAYEYCNCPDYIVKLDADLKFPSHYFESLLEEFQKDVSLGLAGGIIYEYKKEALVKDKVNPFHVRGATKVYRTECYDAIGGIRPVFGWDVIDEILARSEKWNVVSFAHLQLIHLRRTASRGGRFKGWARNGYMAYYIGMSPLRILSRVLYRLLVVRDIVQSLGLAYGYYSSLILFKQRIPDMQLRGIVKEYQWKTVVHKDDNHP